MRVGIIGLGTAGAASAIFLRRAGCHVEVFEKFANPRPIGSGILLQVSGLAVLNKLNVLDTVASHGCVVDRLYVSICVVFFILYINDGIAGQDIQTSHGLKDRILIERG
jgi:2-polyprenyl-6-methoxyphenol hydroxylase-like FAD-dependent oxidoreductase